MYGSISPLQVSLLSILKKKSGRLTLLERLNEMSVPISSLYETLGDLYVKKGDYEKAKRFYLRAIDLADDGFIVVPFVQKKIRKIK